jgi:N-acetylglucosamine-6-phosphate deacetylase
MKIEEFYGSLEGVKIVTLAPEIPGARRAIEFLKKRHIIASAGHTLATYSEMREGFQQGISFATHLFNAMRPMHQREPGAIAAILTNKNLFYSIIADGIHLHSATLELAWRAHPEGLVLITDAINALGLKHGKYQLGSKEIEVQNGKAYISNSTILAGSILSMDAAVRNFKSSVRCSSIEALEAASLKPAQVLGMSHIKGSLAFGADADFNILNDELYVQACYINGLKAYHS